MTQPVDPNVKIEFVEMNPGQGLVDKKIQEMFSILNQLATKKEEGQKGVFNVLWHGLAHIIADTVKEWLPRYSTLGTDVTHRLEVTRQEEPTKMGGWVLVKQEVTVTEDNISCIFIVHTYVRQKDGVL